MEAILPPLFMLAASLVILGAAQYWFSFLAVEDRSTLGLTAMALGVPFTALTLTMMLVH